MNSIVCSIIFGLLLVLCTACIPAAQVQNPNQAMPSSMQLPVIEQFSGNMQSGGHVPSELKWRVTGANIVYIDPGIGEVESSSSREINPARNTIYTLTATNDVGTVRKSTLLSEFYYCPGLPPLEGYNKYIDDINYYGLIYPTSWIITRKYLPDQTNAPSGVFLSNGKPGSDYAYYDVSIEDKEPAFNKRAFADQYKDGQITKGYILESDKTVNIAGDGKAIMQFYTRISSNRLYEHGVIYRYDNYRHKFWLQEYEWPHEQTEYNIRNCFSFCPFQVWK